MTNPNRRRGSLNRIKSGFAAAVRWVAVVGIGALGIWMAFAGFAGGVIPIGLVGLLFAAVTAIPLLVGLFPRRSVGSSARGPKRWLPFATGVVGLGVAVVLAGAFVSQIRWDRGYGDDEVETATSGDGTTVNCFHYRCETWPDTEGLTLRRSLEVLDDFGYRDVVVTAVDADFRTIVDEKGIAIDADDGSHLDWVVVTQTLPDSMLGSSSGPARIQVQAK
ncbi:hypothetical protein GCM10027515_09080 [Schumannella luteola]|uniref:Uncharacterized protein n=1 Tax=Schumannella luteola TaxID=472059 RepID=A0A852YL83_9MICO|nr:hypothetical protein [Schumannella luteola]NYG97965.1 hypothetical protein [Schumannella luteola]TPX01704.1 hypothetical protein FJ656_25220 [Schumannella luteola]